MELAASQIRVAACIVTYRSPLADVEATVNSFLKAKLSSQLLIVDNNSGVDYLVELRERVNVALVESGVNKGFGAGHNIGLRHASLCDYYLVLNPDIIIHEGTLEAMIAYMDAHPDIGLLAPKVLNKDGSLQPLNKRHPTFFTVFARRFLPGFVQQFSLVKKHLNYYMMLDVGYNQVLDIPFISGCFMLFRKSVLDKVGSFDERFFLYFEDADISRRTAEIARTVYYPHASITHGWTRGAHANAKLTLYAVLSAIRYFNKWGWRWL